MTRMFHVSDLHFGKADLGAIDWFAGIVRAEQPDIVVVTGDLTMRGRRREFAAAAEWLQALGVPVTVEPGNHDMPYLNLFERFIDPLRRYRTVERAIERDHDLHNARVISLRTTARAQFRRNWSRGIVRSNSLADALAKLEATRDARAAIVACHHPLVDKAKLASEGRTRHGLPALRALARAGATAVLSGHVHDPFDVTWEEEGRAVRLIGAGTLSERVRLTPPSFNELRIGADGAIDLRVRAMGSDEEARHPLVTDALATHT